MPSRSLKLSRARLRATATRSSADRSSLCRGSKHPRWLHSGAGARRAPIVEEHQPVGTSAFRDVKRRPVHLWRGQRPCRSPSCFWRDVLTARVINSRQRGTRPPLTPVHTVSEHGDRSVGTSSRPDHQISWAAAVGSLHVSDCPGPFVSPLSDHCGRPGSPGARSSAAPAAWRRDRCNAGGGELRANAPGCIPSAFQERRPEINSEAYERIWRLSSVGRSHAQATATTYLPSESSGTRRHKRTEENCNGY